MPASALRKECAYPVYLVTSATNQNRRFFINLSSSTTLFYQLDDPAGKKTPSSRSAVDAFYASSTPAAIPGVVQLRHAAMLDFGSGGTVDEDLFSGHQPPDQFCISVHVKL